MVLVDRNVIRLVSVIYFVQGALGIAGIALPLYLRSSNFSVKEIAFFMSVVSVPWFFKIIYGAVSDAYPICGERRRPYIILCCVAASAGWLLMAVVPAKMVLLALSMMFANLGFAAIDVVTDGVVVEHSTAKTSQIYQSFSWGSRSAGALVSGAAGGYLAATLDYRLIFMMTACLPVISLVAVCFFRENREVRHVARTHFWAPIVKSLRYLISGDLAWMCLLLIVVSLSSSFFTPLFFHMKEQLGFRETLLGWLSSITWFGAICGCFVYLKFMKHMRLKTALYMAIGIGFFEILFCLLIQNRETAIAVFFAGGVLGILSLLPMMSTAARLAHGTGTESSLFAILMGVFNLGQAVSTFCGGWLSERIGLRLLIIMTALFTMSGFWVIGKIQSLRD